MRPLLCTFIAGFMLLIGVVSPAFGADATTTPSLVMVTFRSASGIRMEVYLDGAPAGQTPFRAALQPGEYFLTASAEAVAPILQPYQVEAGGQEAVIPSVPLTEELALQSRSRILSALASMPNNPHLFIMALYLTPDPVEAEHFFKQLDRLDARGDSLVATLESNFALVRGEADESLRLANLATADPECQATGLRQKARVHFMRDELDEALLAVNDAIVCDPNHWMGPELRSRIEDRQENFRAAFNDKQRAAELRAIAAQGGAKN